MGRILSFSFSFFLPSVHCFLFLLIEYQTCGFLTALAIVLALVATKLSARESTPELPPVVYFCRLRCSLLVAVPVIVRRLSID